MADNKVTFRIPNGKNSYVFSFRHPVIKDTNGNGKKIQRGAGTSDEMVVLKLVEQLQELISNEKWHNAFKRFEATEQYDRIVVEAFYDCMPNIVEVNTALDVIPMKSLEEGFPIKTFVGMSGGGKTSLLRKLMGTTKDVFPTTSTNRTTTCDMEVIKVKSKIYEMAVQFISRNELEADLLDNMVDAIEYVMGQMQEDGIIDDIELITKILNHREMATRLSYLLGMPKISVSDEEEDDLEDDYSMVQDSLIDTFTFPEYVIDQEKQDKFLWELEERIKLIAEKYRSTGKSFAEIETDISSDDDVLTLIDDIVSATIEKFDLLKDGRRTNPKAIWPDGWYYFTENYDNFIKKAKIFVSDNYKAWGKLLTPLVKAIRMSGPFIADGETEVVQEVLTDGIGLGHNTNASSLPASVLAKCEKADVIVFVDSAANPMMKNAKDALKSLIEYGYADKLVFAFTKMDLVEGNNYRGLSDKKAHVSTTLSTYLQFLRKQENTVLSETEVQSILANCIYFSYLQKNDISKLTAKALKELQDKTNAIISKNISTEEVTFDYEALKLYYYIKEATFCFRKVWAEKTGYSAITSKTEHWSRIRALARRLGLLGRENYCELQPLADFTTIVQENINIFINQPEKVIPLQTSEEVADELKRIIKREIGIGFRELNKKRMWTDKQPHDRWQKAYYEKGTGSTNRRARIIENIFDEAAPNLADIPNLTEEQEEYLREVIQLVEAVLQEHGCKLRKFRY